MRNPLLIAGLLAVLFASEAGATGQVIHYQGRLTDSNGTPIDGVVGRLSFRIHASDAPPIPTDEVAGFVWGEVHENVQVRRGVFSVLLGAGQQTLSVNQQSTALEETSGSAPFDGSQFTGTERYLELKVNDDPPLRPRTRIGSVAQAVTSQTTNTILDSQSQPQSLAELDLRYTTTSTYPATGGLIFRQSDGSFVGLPIGSDGQVLTVKNGAITWGTPRLRTLVYHFSTTASKSIPIAAAQGLDFTPRLVLASIYDSGVRSTCLRHGRRRDRV